MGSGKSYVSLEVAKLFNDFEQVDIDKKIVASDGREISQIFKEEGEPFFRELETNITFQYCQKEKQIISTGGGVVLNAENRKNISVNGLVFWLNTSPNVIYERIKDDSHRPLINTGASKLEIIATIERMLEARLPLYLESAKVIINTDNLTGEQVAAAICEEYQRLYV